MIGQQDAARGIEVVGGLVTPRFSDFHEVLGFVQETQAGFKQVDQIDEFARLTGAALAPQTVEAMERFDKIGYPGWQAVLSGPWGRIVGEGLLGYVDRKPDEVHAAVEAWAEGFHHFRTAQIDPAVKTIVLGSMSHVLKRELRRFDPLTHSEAGARRNAANIAHIVIVGARRNREPARPNSPVVN